MTENDDELTVVDLFCGAGGISEGFRQNGFKVKLGLDFWEPAIETHELNHPDSDHVLMDVNKLESAEDIDRVIPDADVIVGGPPCQSFSHSNKAGKADKTEGLNLIEIMLRIIAWKKENGGLKYWALENVPNTKKHIKDVYTWEELQLPGDGSPLEVKKKPIHTAADFGVPQERKRMICGNYPDVEKTHEDDWITMKDVFDELKDPIKGTDAEYIEDPCYDLKVKKEELTDHFYDSRVQEYRWKRAKRLKEDHGFMGKMSFPEELDRPSRTVMATRSASTRESMLFGVDKDDDGGYEDYRLPTVREIATFMSFPLTYQFEASTESKKYRLVGNAVPCKLAGAIAKAIADEEGMEVPEGFVPLEGDPEPSLDLTGRERKKRKPRKRKDDSKFARHVPYIKLRGFRVDIDNKESDFPDDVVWTTRLHKGQGRHAAEVLIEDEHVQGMMDSSIKIQSTIMDFEQDPDEDLDVDWDSFLRDLEDGFEGRLPGPEGFQDIYVHRGEGDGYGPNQALEKIRDIIDEHIPKEKYEDVEIDNEGVLDIDVDSVPVRIVACMVACHYVTKNVDMGGLGKCA